MAKDQSPIYSGGADADAKKEYSSFMNDSEARAWERSLYNIDKDQQQKERQRAWEDLDLLWHSVPGTADPLLKYDPLAGALRGYDPLRGSGSADNSSGTTSPDGADAVHSESEGAARSSNSARSTSAGRSASSNSARSRSTRAAKSGSASAKRYDNNARTGAGSTRRYDTNARTDSASGGSSKYGSYRNTTPANAGRSGSTASGRSQSGAWGRSQSTTSGRSQSGSSSSGKKRTALDNAWDTIIGIMEMDGSPDSRYNTGSSEYGSSSSGYSRSSTAYRRNSSKTSVPNRKRTDTNATTSKFVSAMRSGKTTSGKKSPLRVILVVVAVFYVASMLFSFMVSQGLIDRNDIWPWQITEGGGNSGGGSGGGSGGDNTDGGDDGGIFHGGDQSGQYSNPYPDGTVLTEFGFDYADFYTSKYICSYEDTSASSHKYQELCVVDNNELVGTSDSPKNSDRLYSNHVEHMQYTLHYYLGGSYLPCGFTVQYADSVPSVNFYSAGTLYPPRTANQADFFETVLRELSDLDDDNHKNLAYKKLNKFLIGDHDITYLEFTYEDSNGNKILDVISFEQKPLDCAFTAEYRCVQDDFDSAEAALEYLYGMLTFHTDSFENVDASRHRFSSARVYNSKNTNSAKIDLEDLGEPLYSEAIFKNTASFTYDGYNDYDDPSLRVSLDYIAYNVINDHGGFENWISKTLEQAASPNGRTSDVQETAREQFTFYAKKAYYLSYTGTEEIAKTTEYVQYHKYLIETKEGGTLSLEVKYIHDIPEDFDPHKFLSRHLELKFAE